MSAVAQGMAGLALILGYALLFARRTGLALLLSGLQALAVAVALAARHDLPAAAVNLAGAALAIPWLLHGQAAADALRPTGYPSGRSGHPSGHPSGRIPGQLTGFQAWGLPARLAAAAALSLLAVTAGTLALPLAVLFMALLLLVCRPDPVRHALGLCSLQQAALLAASGAGGSLPLLALAVAVPVLPGLAVAALALGRLDGSVRS